MRKGLRYVLGHYKNMPEARVKSTVPSKMKRNDVNKGSVFYVGKKHIIQRALANSVWHSSKF